MPKTPVTIAALAVVAVVAAACTSSSSTGGSTSGSTPAPTTGVTTQPTSSPAPATSDPTTTAPAGKTLTVSDAGGKTSLTFSADFVKTLYTNNLTTAPVGDATLKPVGTSGKTDISTLPVTGGTLSATEHGVTAKLQHVGSGLVVSSGSKSLKLTDFTLVLDGTSSVITAQATTAGDAPVSTVTVFQLTPTPGGKIAKSKFTLAQMRMYLTPAAAAEFDTALGTSAFASTGAHFAGTVTTVAGRS